MGLRKDTSSVKSTKTVASRTSSSNTRAKSTASSTTTAKRSCCPLSSTFRIRRTADGNEDEVHCGTELDVGIVDKRTNFMYHSASPAGSEVGFTLCANKWNEE